MSPKIGLIFLLISLFSAFSNHLLASENTLSPSPIPDTSFTKRTFKEWSKSGEFEFHWRTFFMSTLNKGELLDYSALGTGAGLGYSSPHFKGFQVVFSGFFVFQLHEHNITIADPITDGVNRYELTLFDMNDLENRTDLDRLEELFFRYERKGFVFTFGRQKFSSPLLNMQDNRMRPNIFSGIHANYKWNNWEFLAAGFHAMTIRGTLDWYSVEESLGVYPFGRSPFGVSSDYKGNIRSKGIGVLGIKQKGQKVKSELWNYTAENIFNLSFAQSEYRDSLFGLQWTIGAQCFYQMPLNFGGNEDPLQAFIVPGQQTFGLGGKIETKLGKHTVSLNNLHISDRGRFLFPREWGREIFFASLPRERFEGNGGVNAYTLKYSLNLPRHDWVLNFGASTVYVPDMNNVMLNKYGMPAYHHLILGVDHGLAGFFDGLHLRFLAVNKIAQNRNIPDIYRINRVDMWQFNFVVDYLF